MRHTILVAFLLCASTAFAQVKKPMIGNLPPGRSLEPVHKPHADSVKFNAAFRELYPIIKPPGSVREHAEAQWAHMWRMYKTRGLDSLVTHDSIMHAIDTNMQYDILYNEYRDQFSAEELQSLVGFFKSAAGKHFLEVEPRLFAARNGALDQYVRSTMNSVTTPMLMSKNMREQGQGMPPPPPMAPNGQPRRQATQHNAPDSTK